MNNKINNEHKELLNACLAADPNNAFLKGKHESLERHGCFTERQTAVMKGILDKFNAPLTAATITTNTEDLTPIARPPSPNDASRKAHTAAVIQAMESKVDAEAFLAVLADNPSYSAWDIADKDVDGTYLRISNVFQSNKRKAL